MGPCPTKHHNHGFVLYEIVLSHFSLVTAQLIRQPLYQTPAASRSLHGVRCCELQKCLPSGRLVNIAGKHLWNMFGEFGSQLSRKLGKQAAQASTAVVLKMPQCAGALANWKSITIKRSCSDVRMECC